MKHWSEGWRAGRRENGLSETPGWTEAFRLGYFACKEGRMPSANPFLSSAGMKMVAWDAGFAEAELDLKGSGYLEGGTL